MSAWGHGGVIVALAALGCGGTTEGASPTLPDASVDAPNESASVADAPLDARAEGTTVADASNEPEGAAPILACAGFADAGDAQGCTGVDRLVLSNPSVTSDDGGAPSPGASGQVEVLLSDPTNGPQISDYPAVCFATDTPGVTLGPNNPAPGLFAIGPGMSGMYGIGVTFSASLAPGTVIHFGAQATALNRGCTNGAALQWDVTLP